MKKIMAVFGTRPEAIKMCPLVRELRKSEGLEVVVCVTGQHRELLRPILEVFGVTPDYDLDILRPGQDLYDITGAVLMGLRGLLARERPDLVLVHGDTTTAYASAVAAFYARVPVGHVEAGLRTGRLDAPYPEEFNRQGIDLLASLYFAPTETARQNLLREGRAPERIFVTGNTGIDALRTTVRADYRDPLLDWAEGSRLLVVTAHRRESLGPPMRAMFRGLRRVVEEFGDVKAVFPVHLNPAVREAAGAELTGCDRIRLVEPLPVTAFHNLLSRSELILTDSGGIQEEASALGKPVLVMRDTTERPEGVCAGTLLLAGVTEEGIYRRCRALLTDPAACRRMSAAANPYGDGHASERIRLALERTFS